MKEDILAIIADYKQQEVASAKKNFPLEKLLEKIEALEATRPFVQAIEQQINQKKCSRDCGSKESIT